MTLDRWGQGLCGVRRGTGGWWGLDCCSLSALLPSTPWWSSVLQGAGCLWACQALTGLHPPWRAAVLTAPWMGGSRGSLARTAGSALRYPARGQRRPAAHAPGAVPWQLESFPPTGRAENGSEGVAGPGPPQGGLSGRAGG